VRVSLRRCRRRGCLIARASRPRSAWSAMHTSRRVDGGGAASDGAATTSAQPSGRGCSAAGRINNQRGQESSAEEEATGEGGFLEAGNGKHRFVAINAENRSASRTARRRAAHPLREGSRLTLAPSVCSADSYNHGHSRRLL